LWGCKESGGREDDRKDRARGHEYVLRRRLRRLYQDDARLLVERNPVTAYYDVQRAAARARFADDGVSFRHWAKVAAEVARISNAPMDYEIVKAIVKEEEERAGSG
jgi:hypothetical protein